MHAIRHPRWAPGPSGQGMRPEDPRPRVAKAVFASRLRSRPAPRMFHVASSSPDRMVRARPRSPWSSFPKTLPWFTSSTRISSPPGCLRSARTLSPSRRGVSCSASLIAWRWRGCTSPLKARSPALAISAGLKWKASGYRIEIAYLSLATPQLALRRIAARVRQGGHDVPPQDVLRRFDQCWTNFDRAYKHLADAWTVYDNSGPNPGPLEKGP